MGNLIEFQSAFSDEKPEQQLINAIMSQGLTPPTEIILDGEIHRFSTRNGKDDSGWYVAYDGVLASGAFGCWRSNINMTWTAKTNRALSDDEKEISFRRILEAKEKAQQAKLTRNIRSAEEVNRIWESSKGASPDHPYLKRKGIRAGISRISNDGRLIVPLMDINGTLWSLQYIDHEGNKRFQYGGSTGGKCCKLGEISDKVFVAEGYATGSTIYETTGICTIIAYSANNLDPVVGDIRSKYPNIEIVIVADNDESKVGENHANQAASNHRASVIVPPVLGDVNDYKLSGGNIIQLLQADATIIDKMQVIFGDELSDEYEAPDEVIQDLIVANSMTVIYGDSNSGKTFFALSLAASLSEGKEIYGKQVDQGLVVYLACESPGSIKCRMQALKKHHGFGLSNLAMVPMPLNFYTNQGDAMDVIKLVDHIERMKGQKVKAIFADTLARMSAGANENSGEDMGPVMERFSMVTAKTGAAMVIIHHNGKDTAKGARGWSGIRAHIETEIEVVEQDGNRFATITKQRELASKGQVISFNLEVVVMGVSKFGSDSSTCVAVPGEEVKSSNNKVEAPMKSLSGAWYDSGCEIKDSKPFVSKDAWITHLIERDGMSESSSKQHVKPSADRYYAKKLVDAGLVEYRDSGFYIIDKTWSFKLKNSV